jgi:DNA (cytosine-5)-methyltransferase 1
MNHKEILLDVYNLSSDISDIQLPSHILKELDLIVSNIDRSKWVYTVLVTLLVHKLFSPKQDIRYFQNKMPNGFSARSIDTAHITPTLKELWLPSMAESWWLTRSLEQPYPYTMDYKWEISGTGMKNAFLYTVDFIENNPEFTKNILRVILHNAISFRENNKVVIEKITEWDDILISAVIEILEEHFQTKYWTHWWSKLPVLAFYAIYQSLIWEIGRYKDCVLWELWSHTASDRTSNSAWDIQILKNGKVIEAIEVKLDKAIDLNIARIWYEKIARFNTRRYYILSYIGIKEEDEMDIKDLILEIQENHWCQLIVNWLLHTLKYYLRLIDNPSVFFNRYIELVEADGELKAIHKETLRSIIDRYQLWKQS